MTKLGHQSIIYIIFLLIGGLSQGGVAGVVITVLIIVALLVGGGVAIGIVLWVHQPWSNGWYGVEEKLKKMNRRSECNYST